ncbi:MAG: ATP-binding cassette domain-containing protein [Defluviitaleaceae bacterium]|nr:ATP-binding cassette domain-containing protein [Defluviitaleaceae bacterium]
MSLFVDIRKKLGKFSLDVTFETSGGTLGLLGASGSGKSMTLMCISGVEKPDEGRIVLDDVTLFDSERRVNLPPQQRRIGYLFQNYALFPHMTVRQNILCGLRNERDKSRKENALREILDLMQLNGLEKHRPSQLSGGQQQRVALARILVGEPNLLMLDEPFSALDSHLRDQLQIQTRQLIKQFGKDTLIVTHNRDEAYRLCQKIALIGDGKNLAPKDTKELFANPESRQAALMTGCKNIADAEKTGEYEVFVPAWGIRLTTARPVRDGLCAVAIRAHYFNTEDEFNRYPVRFTNEMEEPFEYILQFRYENQDDDSPDIWRRIPKDKKSGQPPDILGVAPVNVLPLYGG